MSTLTDEAKSNYVRKGWGKCPFCQSSNIVAGKSDWQGNTVGSQVTCENCDQVWWDIYTLTDIQPCQSS